MVWSHAEFVVLNIINLLYFSLLSAPSLTPFFFLSLRLSFFILVRFLTRSVFLSLFRSLHPVSLSASFFLPLSFASWNNLVVSRKLSRPIYILVKPTSPHLCIIEFSVQNKHLGCLFISQIKPNKSKQLLIDDAEFILYLKRLFKPNCSNSL